MFVRLMIPCLVEDCRPEAGLAAAAVLERLGLAVEVPPGQTCCGQLAWKAGDAAGARALALRVLELFPGPEPVVCPSGSCAKMLRTYPELFAPGTREHARALDLAGRTFEFCAFVDAHPNLPRLDFRLEARACLHRSCQLDGSEAPLRLLSRVAGLAVVEPERPERCCGFGGLFSVQFPAVSESLLEDKAHEILATGADLVVSAEPSCLMNIGGYLARLGRATPARHMAEVLAKALGAGPEEGAWS